MLSYDFSPLFHNTIGFDRFTRLIESSLEAGPSRQAYPPYNIESTNEDAYRITMAVAGFTGDELSIEVRENTLTIVGGKAEEEGASTYLHRGIAGRDFVSKFQLADHVKVADAYLDNGLLSVDLVRQVPDALKPRLIEIKSQAPDSLVAKAKKLVDGSAKKKAA